MALPGSKIKNKNRLKKRKFRPLGQGVKNQYGLRKSINRRTEGVIGPKLNVLRRKGLEERQASQGRNRDLKEMYGFESDRVREAFREAESALDNMLAQTGGAQTGAMQTLMAALEESRAGDREQASTIGGVIPEGLGDETAVSALAAGNAGLANLANISSGATKRAADTIGNTGLARRRALTDEQQRFEAIRQQIQKEEQGILMSIPAVREEQRKAILDEEMAKATERSRQKLARESLKLEKRKTGNEEEQAAASNKIAWAQIRNEKEALRAEVAGATTNAGREKAEARAEQYESGVEAFTDYLNSNKKNPQPGEAYRILTLTVPRAIALKIMKAGPKAFRNFKPGKGKKKPPLKKGPPNPVTGKVGP